MNSNKMKIVIVDENEARSKQVKKYMPLYVEAFCVSYGDAAKAQIRPDADGRLTDMVIMNADDSKGHGLYMFDWMKNEEQGLGLEKIPVLLLIEDEFSDRALEFLELGDAEFYEGELEEDRLYSKMMDTFDRADFAPEPKEEPHLYTEERTTNKVSGLTIKPVGEGDSVKRSVVLSLDEQRHHLAAALERGRKRNEQIREMVFNALRRKEEMKAASGVAMPNTAMPSGNASVGNTASGNTSVINAAKGKAASGNAASGKILSNTVPSGTIPTGMPAMGAGGFPNLMSHGSPQVPLPVPMLSAESFKKTIVVADSDERTRKTCELFLQSRYEVVTADTGMRAIDYFVRAKADLMLLNYHMPLLDGPKILASIRWQPNGKTIPVIFMTEMADLMEITKRCRQEGAIGVLPKPIVQATLLHLVESVLSESR